jgi:hypothetical protein
MLSYRRCAQALTLLFAGSLPLTGFADVVATSRDGVWQVLDRMPPQVTAQPAWIRPQIYAPAQLDHASLSRLLSAAPLEGTAAAANPLTVILPMPQGGFASFAVIESPVMEPPLQAQFPQIRTYLGQGIDDPTATVRFDRTPLGFHAQVLAPTGAVYIDPYSRGDTTHYAVYFKRDYSKANDGWVCTAGEDEIPVEPAGGETDTPSGTTLRTYRLACACTGEYAAFFGGTVANAQAAIVTAVNRITGVYEKECAIRMVLVGNNSSVVYTNGSTDPYTNSSGSTMLSQNQTTLDSVIGSANYDIGHVFSTGGGGIAQLGCVGVAGAKAKGVTGLPSPTGDPFYIDYVAHEMGHQYGANHCFNSSTSACSGNRSATHAYEPGSASTIMGYAGICGADDLQPHSDPYFGFDGHDAIIAYTSAGAGGGSPSTTGNSIPAVNGGPDYRIPANTPFALTATGSDGNGDTLTYSWEEADLGATTTLAQGDTGSGPIIRVLNPTVSPTRTVPRLSNLLANTTVVGERLPTTTRTLNWRVCARDNRANGGGWNSDSVVISVTNTGAAFAVTSPNSAVSWSGTQTVTWNVAGTTASPISCANVDILLSTDGGNTFPTTLLASTPNTGSAVVTLPSISTSAARIKVAAVGSIFFDLSNSNFTITPAPPANDSCANAATLAVGSTPFTTVGASTDGPLETGCAFCCSDFQVNQDVWYTFQAPCTGRVTVSLCGSSYNSKLAVYEGAACPTSVGSAMDCDDDACAPSGPSSLSWEAIAGALYKVRVGGFQSATGSGTINVTCVPAGCYANCDGSTSAPVLNVADFTCFLQRYAGGEPYANCDGSTVEPVLNVADFTCFLQQFSAGCP